MLTEKEIDSIVEKIVQRLNPEKVIVFGSYVKGTATIKSDLDILIVKDTVLPMSQRGSEVRSFFQNSLIPINCVIYTPSEIEIYRKEKYSFIWNILNTEIGKEKYFKLK